MRTAVNQSRLALCARLMKNCHTTADTATPSARASSNARVPLEYPKVGPRVPSTPRVPAAKAEATGCKHPDADTDTDKGADVHIYTQG